MNDCLPWLEVNNKLYKNFSLLIEKSRYHRYTAGFCAPRKDSGTETRRQDHTSRRLAPRLPGFGLCRYSRDHNAGRERWRRRCYTWDSPQTSCSSTLVQCWDSHQLVTDAVHDKEWYTAVQKYGIFFTLKSFLQMFHTFGQQWRMTHTVCKHW